MSSSQEKTSLEIENAYEFRWIHLRGGTRLWISSESKSQKGYLAECDQQQSRRILRYAGAEYYCGLIRCACCTAPEMGSSFLKYTKNIKDHLLRHSFCYSHSHFAPIMKHPLLPLLAATLFAALAYGAATPKDATIYVDKDTPPPKGDCKLIKFNPDSFLQVIPDGFWCDNAWENGHGVL